MKISLNLYNTQAFGKNKASKNKAQAQTKSHAQSKVKEYANIPGNIYAANYGIHPATTIYEWKQVDITNSENELEPPRIKVKDSKPQMAPNIDFDEPGNVAYKFKTPQAFIKYHLDSLTEIQKEVSDIYDEFERYQEMSRSYQDIILDNLALLNLSDISTLPNNFDCTTQEKFTVALLYSYFSQDFDGGPVNGFERPEFIKSVKQSLEDASKHSPGYTHLPEFLSDIQCWLPRETYSEAEQEFSFELKEGARNSAIFEAQYERERSGEKPFTLDFNPEDYFHGR